MLLAMAFAQVKSAQTQLITAECIDIEVDVSRGIHSFAVVGLADKAVDEAKDRISSAIKYSGFRSPKHTNQKVVISLAPAQIPKNGVHFDLAMAIGYLLAAEDIKANTDGSLFLGELSLDGTLRPIKGTLPLIAHAKSAGFKRVFVPMENRDEASLVSDIEIYGAENLKRVAEHLEKKITLPVFVKKISDLAQKPVLNSIDMGDIKGQDIAKRALLIAAAGGHNIALWGPPGTGKTMLARACCGIIPELSFEESLEVTAIYSVAGLLKEPLISIPPFRSPHHTASHTSLVGGGSIPRPGEITLAHKGVLFLDELPEFGSETLETLREPLEERVITISRARGSGSFPADFTLIVAMNPCPCGNHGIKHKTCTCTPVMIDRYKKKLSGPIIDRISMWVEVSLIEYDKLLDKDDSRKKISPSIKEEVRRARLVQHARSEKNVGRKLLNSRVRDIPYWLGITEHARTTLNTAAKKLFLSGRSYRNIISVARTIADLDRSLEVGEQHILEALQYRAEKLY